MIKEDFLHFVWLNLKFDTNKLKCTDGKSIQILDKGYLNCNSGPDFSDAKIRIGEILWIGNVEIHIRSGDWFKHKHHIDPAYDNVILHVVLEEDENVKDRFGNPLPCLEMKKRIFRDELKKYKLLQRRNGSIPCQELIGQADDIAIARTIERAFIQRLEKKALRILNDFARSNNNVEQSFIISLFRYFGKNINSDTFEKLAYRIPFQVLQKERSSLFSTEALLLGLSGFLESEFADDYAIKLKRQYSYLQKKYELKNIDSSLWKFLRMRPASFPTVRLAQLAALIHRHTSFSDKIRDMDNADDIDHFFRAIASEYWTTHNSFDKRSKKRIKSISKEFRTLLIINVISPFLFAYGSLRNENNYKIKAADLLNDLPAEKNRISRFWIDLKLPVVTAFDSQAFIELKHFFCDKKRCMNCPVGQDIMNGKLKNRR